MAETKNSKSADDALPPEVLAGTPLNIHLIRNENLFRFWVVDKENALTLVTSRDFKTPKDARDALIGMILAIRSDEFETFDHTEES